MYIIDSMSMRGSLQSLDEIHPIQITSWTPTSVEPSAPFDIYYTIQNTSTATAWQVFGYLLDGSGSIISGSEWDSGTNYLGVGQSMSSPHYAHAGINSAINITIVVGHIGLDSFTLSASLNPSAGGYFQAGSTANGSYSEGQAISITAVANTGYTFASWTGSGLTGLPSTNPNLSFQMPANNVTVQANFTTQNTYMFSAMENPAAGGTISGTADGAYAQNTSISITANPANGYSFLNWTGSGISGLPNTNQTVSFNMPANTVTLQANFQVIGGTDCSDPSGANGQLRCIDGYMATCNNGAWSYSSPPAPCDVDCDSGDIACVNGFISSCEHGSWTQGSTPCVPTRPTNWLLIGALVAASIIGSAFIIGRK